MGRFPFSSPTMNIVRCGVEIFVMFVLVVIFDAGGRDHVWRPCLLQLVRQLRIRKREIQAFVFQHCTVQYFSFFLGFFYTYEAEISKRPTITKQDCRENGESF